VSIRDGRLEDKVKCDDGRGRNLQEKGEFEYLDYTRMRTTAATRKHARLDRIISPSTEVVYGLIIPRFAPIRINSTVHVHDPLESRHPLT
jgi:hypothetical protein